MISTVNGSGSATANNILLRAIFKMGIPAAGRNIFPSNIQGMPTWYSIRVNEKGYLGRKEKSDIVICMNSAVINDDIKFLEHGGLLILDDTIKYEEKDKDFEIFKLPVDNILDESNAASNLRIYLANMVYVGVLAAIIGLDLLKIEDALNQHFEHSNKAVEPNMNVVRHAYNWTISQKSVSNGYKLKQRAQDSGKIITNGNIAAALGSLYGGMQFAAWYPITPATGVAEAINEYIPRLRIDNDTGSTTCAVVQAEDELAAIGMVIGAGWAGLRSMTATSGPGLCLMSEFLGLAYFAEVPVVVWDVQRVGPSTGLPTRTSQGDLNFAYNLGHGDTDMIVLLPGNINECFEFGWKALDLAEKYQTPVVVLSDLELGMNDWINDAFKYPDEEINRGKILWEKDLQDIIDAGKQWGRYLDLDGDGIPYRTLPGNEHPKASYFARGTGHDAFAHYSEEPENWKENLDRLKRKYHAAVEDIPEPLISQAKNSRMGIIAYGSTDIAMSEVMAILNKNKEEFSYLRIRAIPFTSAVGQFLESNEIIFVVEANRDGQLKNILAAEFPNYSQKLTSIAKIDGLSLSAEWITNSINQNLQEK